MALSALEISALRSQGVSEEEIARRNLGDLPMATFGGNNLPMGVAGYIGKNPIIDPNMVTPATVMSLDENGPTPVLVEANPGVYHDVNDPPLPPREPELPQDTRPVVQQQAEQMQAAAMDDGTGIGGPGGPVNNQMQGYDPFGSFAAGFAGSQAPAYSGSLQAIAAAFGGGSAAMQRDMAETRRSLVTGKYGNTPIPYQKPDGTMGMGRMAPDGTFLPMEVPGGGEFLKPTTWLNTGTGHMPAGYGQTAPTPGAQQVMINPPPETAPTYKGEQTAATAEATRVADINVARPKARNMLEAVNVKADFVSGTIDEAIDNITNFSTGFGAYLSKVPGTQAKYLSGLMDTVRANVGFEALQEMRNNSPTGGALGQVSERELELLNSTIGKLDQAQTSDQLKGILKEIQGIVKGRGARMRAAFDRDYGGDTNTIDKYGEPSSAPNNLPDFPDPE